MEQCDLVFEALLEALSRLHAEGRVHGGLHPERIQLLDDERVKLGGRRADPRYRAPELGPVASPDARADLYAAGLIVWELYARRPACPHGTVHQARTWHTKQGPWPLHRIRREVPEWLGVFLSQLYERDPRFRPVDARVALSRFLAAQREPPVVLKLSADRGTPRRWSFVRRFVKPMGDEQLADGPGWGIERHVVRVTRNTLGVLLLMALALKFFPDLGEVVLAQDEAGVDSDGDGVPDGLDRCVDTPEDRDGDRDLDGCPDGGPALALAASDDTTCALERSGRVSCWGAELGGEPPEGAFDELAIGSGWACVLDTEGQASCWGRRASEPPERRLTSLSMRGGSACGLDADGALWCWGADAGELERRSTTMGSLGPGLCAVDGWGGAVCTASVAVDDTFEQVAGSSDFAACGRTRSGVRCWGRGAPEDREGSFVDLAVGSRFVCALDDERRAQCWGSVPDTAPSSGMIDLVTGDDHVCGLRLDGRVHCWGDAGEVPDHLAARAQNG